MSNRRAPKTAFTLLEVMLALGLTVVVMSIIGMAIHLHLRSVDHARVGIERDQLARTLLRRIADDVRATIRREPFDSSGLEAMMGKGAQGAAKSAMAGSAGASDDSSGKSKDSSGVGKAGTTSSAASAGTTQTLTSSSDSSTSDAGAAAGTPSAVPGLYGTAYELQIDIGRVPRLDEFSAAMTSGAPLPSDVKTVYYFVVNAASGLSANGETGLMRSEMNRAAALYASENGQLDAFMQMAEPVASEVLSLEFRYFDGFEWLSEWNSQEKNGLPLAIEIALVVVDPTNADAATASGSLFDATLAGIDPELIYHTIVQLPNGQISQSPSGTSTDSSSDQGITDLGSSSTGGSSGGSSQPK